MLLIEPTVPKVFHKSAQNHIYQLASLPNQTLWDSKICINKQSNKAINICLWNKVRLRKRWRQFIRIDPRDNHLPKQLILSIQMFLVWQTVGKRLQHQYKPNRLIMIVINKICKRIWKEMKKLKKKSKMTKSKLLWKDLENVKSLWIIMIILISDKITNAFYQKDKLIVLCVKWVITSVIQNMFNFWIYLKLMNMEELH